LTRLVARGYNSEVPLAIASETGRLRAVITHLPGAEIDRMLPSMMGELLFDDILFGDRAREEHRRLRRLIEFVADEVLEAQELLADVVRDDGVRAAVLADIESKLNLTPEALALLQADTAETLAAHLIEGVLRPGVTRMPENPHDLYLLEPIPNFFFQRDPAIVIGDRVAVASMATEARLREPLLMGYLFAHHPRLASATGSAALFQPFDVLGSTHSIANPRPTFEGGDVLVVRDDILVIGVSARTRRNTIEQLAAALRARKAPIRKLLVVDLPKARSFMHLDTVFTVISRDECLIYEPAILPGEVEEVDVYELDLGRREVTYTAKASLLAALKAAGLDLKPIACGGPDDPIAQQREQWTDGANAFALAPGVILCYERNVKTAEQLDKAGYEVVYEDDLLLGRVELDLGKRKAKKYAIQMTAHELSRARGGPRCMTLPLEREPL
jgi:arginine deiminase